MKAQINPIYKKMLKYAFALGVKHSEKAGKNVLRSKATLEEIYLWSFINAIGCTNKKFYNQDATWQRNFVSKKSKRLQQRFGGRSGKRSRAVQG